MVGRRRTLHGWISYRPARVYVHSPKVSLFDTLCKRMEETHNVFWVIRIERFIQ